MAEFRDSRGRRWIVNIDAEAVARVRELIGVDLAGLLDPACELHRRLVADPALLVDTLWALVAPEAHARGVSDEEFGRALGGRAIDAATRAMLSAMLAYAKPAPAPRAAPRSMVGRLLGRSGALN